MDCELIENIKSVQLTKLALNIPFITLMAKEGLASSEILVNPSLENERQMLQAEIIQASNLFGAPVDKPYLEKVIDSLKKMPVIPPSSQENYKAAMMKELPFNAGALLKLMGVYGIKLPKLEDLFLQICPSYDFT